MYIFEKGELSVGTVFWAYTANFYDQPQNFNIVKRRLYVVIKEMPTTLLACALSTAKTNDERVILPKEKYPIKFDSGIKECIYCVNKSDISSPKLFKVDDKTMATFKRKLYQRIIRGAAEGVPEYDELFINDYLSETKPKVGDVIIYPRQDKERFENFYIYGEDEKTYHLIELLKNNNVYSIKSPKIVLKDKNERFYTYYCNHNLTQTGVERALEKIKIKRLNYPKS